MGGDDAIQRTMCSPAVRLVLLIAVLCWADRAIAAQLNFGAGYRAEYSDNLNRASSDRGDLTDLTHILNGQFSFLENTNTIVARLNGSLESRRYQDDTFDPQTYYRLDAYGELFIWDRTFSWVAADGYRTLQVDPLLPDTPVNRTDSNVWATGPNFYLRLSPVDTAVFEGRYGRTWVENQSVDNSRVSYATRWVHRHSSLNTSSLNFEKLGIDYRNINETLEIPYEVVNTDITRYNTYYQFAHRNLRTQISLDLGRTRIERARLDPVNDWLTRLSMSALLGTISSLTFQYRREFTDIGAELLPASPALPLPGMNTVQPTLGMDVLSGEPYYLSQASLHFSRLNSLFPFGLSVYSRKIYYSDLYADRQERGLSSTIGYHYSRSVTFQFSGAYNVLGYDDVVEYDRNNDGVIDHLDSWFDRIDDERNVGLALIYRMTPHLTLSLDARRYKRTIKPVYGVNSPTISLEDQHYTEDRIGISVQYVSRPSGY
jgi:hypothetical protein